MTNLITKMFLALMAVGMLFDTAHGWMPKWTTTKSCPHSIRCNDISRMPLLPVGGRRVCGLPKTCLFAKPKAGPKETSTSKRRSPAAIKREETWSRMVERLKDYKGNCGNIDVPRRFNDGMKPHLGNWISSRRKKYREGSLPQDKIDELEKLGIKWALSREGRPQQRDAQSWNNTFQRLVIYKQLFGNTLVHGGYNDGGKPLLRKWVYSQRCAYKTFVNTGGRAGHMTQERIDKLNSIGFVWNNVQQLQQDQQWISNFKAFKEFQSKYNSTKPPVLAADSTDPISSIGYWVRHCICHYNKLLNGRTAVLTADQIEMMNSTGFSWTYSNKTEHEKWLHQYFRLYYHHYQYNNTDVSDSDTYNSRFVNWVAQQKQAYHDGKLDQLKIELLNELDFDWTIDPKPSWEDYYSQLCQYHKKYKTTLLNKRINRNLAMWCKKQRILHEKNKLEIEKISKLEALNFDWDPVDEDWNAMYERLLIYMNRHGNVLVPVTCAEDPPLGKWMEHQHRGYSKHMRGQEIVCADLIDEISNKVATKKIPVEVHMARLAKLVDIGFIWDRKEVQWLTQYQKLVAFKQYYNSTLVPKEYEKDPPLGWWVAKQRESHASGKLEQKRKALLDDLGFEWFPKEARWCEMFQRLCVYKEVNGNANVPKKYADDPELGIWVHTQRALYRSKRIAPHRVEKLEGIGFVWTLVYVE